MRYDVHDFGAVGNGGSYDTAAIQDAIDACSENGGGTVELRNGTYLVGTLFLKSNVDLHIASTATLLGATDLSKYSADKQMPYQKISPSLIYASGCHDIAITGSGMINFQGEHFANEIDDVRPSGIRFRDCEGITIEGVLLRNAGAFMIHPIHCSGIRVNGIRIDNMAQPNGDGIDLDGCQDVFISNCHIVSSDDSIALKTIEHGQPCCDVVVTNCILSSLCAAIRVGPDAVEDIMRLTVSNCIIRDTRLNGIKIQESFGAVMRDMTFSNIVMDNVGGPISIRLAGWKLGDTNEWALFDDSDWENGELRNVLFDNIRATGMNTEWKLGISITGTSKTRPKMISFSNIDITFPGGGTLEEGERRNVPDMERVYPECMIFGVLPAYGLYAHHADYITLSNVLFTTYSDEHRPSIVCDDVSNFDIMGFKAQGHRHAPLIRLENSHDAHISHFRAIGESASLVKVEGPQSQDISVVEE